MLETKQPHRDIVPGGLFQMGDVGGVLWSDYYDAEKGGIATHACAASNLKKIPDCFVTKDLPNTNPSFVPPLR